VIRPYEAGDLHAVVDVWRAASLVATPFLSAAFLDEEERQIRDAWMARAESWVYEDGGRVSGFVSLVGDEVGGLFVHPGAQGRGIGRALMDHAVALRGRLTLEVFERNGSGRGFYARYGFREIGRNVHEATGQPQVQLEFDPG
jgi:putative acetyltransferase